MEKSRRTVVQKKSILLVDDDKGWVTALTRRLEETGYTVISCGRVSEAILKLSNQQFDCIILDLRLEQGDGQRIVSLLRGDTSGYNSLAPILVVSGYIAPEVIQSIGKKIQGALVKPVDPQSLLTKIESLCNSAGKGKAISR